MVHRFARRWGPDQRAGRDPPEKLREGSVASARVAARRLNEHGSVRWIAFSHFEADECGALNQWLAAAPAAQPACSANGALVSVNSVAERPARGLQDGEIIETGAHRFRFLATPHLPHGWDAGHLYDETTGTLLCSDLLHQNGDVEPVTSADVVARMKAMFEAYRGTPFDFYMPWTAQTEGLIERLAGLEPVVCAPMHGSAYAGDGGAALREMAVMMREVAGAIA